MSYNGSGTFNINSAGQPVVSGTVISSTAFNALTSDLATGLTTALTKDGQTTPTANITLGGYKITNLAAGTAATDAVRFDQLTGAGVPLITVAGTADAITGTITPSLTAYTAGGVFSFVVGSTNTTAVTLNIDGLGVKSVTRTGSVALVAGDMVTGQVVLVEYDGTRFQLLNGNSFTNLKASGTLGVTGLTTLGVTGAVFPGSSSGTATIVAPATAGTPILTLPATTGTFALTSNVTASNGQGRLTLTTLVPVTTADVTGATTLYYTPYEGNQVPIYNGSTFSMTTFAELSQATTDSTKSPTAVAASKVYDIFVWSDSGTIRATRGPAWTNDTTRGTGVGTSELQMVSGILTNKVAITNGAGANLATFVGTVRSDSSSQLNDSVLLRHVWNKSNRVNKSLKRVESTSTWTYTTAAYRQVNASTANQVDIVAGLNEDSILLTATGGGKNNTGNVGLYTGIGLDSTTVNSAVLSDNVIGAGTGSSHINSQTSAYNDFPGLGRHFFVWLEYSQAIGVTTWSGFSAGVIQAGITGTWRC